MRGGTLAKQMLAQPQGQKLQGGGLRLLSASYLAVGQLLAAPVATPVETHSLLP